MTKPTDNNILAGSDTLPSYDPKTFTALTFHDRPRAFVAGEDSPRDYLERCIETIEAREPTVKAWVSVNYEGARAAADASTRRYREGRPLSSIDGMPIGIKDLFNTRDMPTKMGSPLYEHNFPKQDSASIQALRAAGALILGKTVTTELGMSHAGPTTNPFSEIHSPGGSSSGSAAAVGARMVPVTLGSQVVGSCIRPAGFCGNYALKPTLGAIHRGERLAFSQSHIGVHAGSLLDMWNVAYEIARRAGGDPGYFGLTGPAVLHAPLRPHRLVVVEAEGWQHTSERIRAAFEGLLDMLRDAGVEIVTRRDNPVVEAFEQAIGDSLALCRDICAYELRWTLDNLLAEHGGGLSESLMTRHRLSQQMTIDQYREVITRRETARRSLRAVASAGDAMICLSSVETAPLLDNKGMDSGVEHRTGLPAFNAWTSITGAPAITLPFLALDGLPLGVQVVGQQHGDHHLTGIAEWMRALVLGAMTDAKAMEMAG
jgi:Asp-tRNA(Asn)/Glu-tRNA(Gln) amidotransferase A subunit family amidase